jgi:hypothetical protein
MGVTLVFTELCHRHKCSVTSNRLACINDCLSHNFPINIFSGFGNNLIKLRTRMGWWRVRLIQPTVSVRRHVAMLGMTMSVVISKDKSVVLLHILIRVLYPPRIARSSVYDLMDAQATTIGKIEDDLQISSFTRSSLHRTLFETLQTRNIA